MEGVGTMMTQYRVPRIIALNGFAKRSPSWSLANAYKVLKD